MYKQPFPESTIITNCPFLDFDKHTNFFRIIPAFAILALCMLMNCVADIEDENGLPPTFTFRVSGPGVPSLTISSDQACPPDGLSNNFDTVFLSLAANKTYQFLYAMTDYGGMRIMDFESHDTTNINFEVLDPVNVEILTFDSDKAKMVRLVGGAEPRTSLLLSGNLYTQDVRRNSTFVFQGWDLSGNHIFHTLTVIVAPRYVTEVFYEGDCR